MVVESDPPTDTGRRPRTSVAGWTRRETGVLVSGTGESLSFAGEGVDGPSTWTLYVRVLSLLRHALAPVSPPHGPQERTNVRT